MSEKLEYFNKYENPDARCSYPFELHPLGYCFSYALHIDGDPKFTDMKKVCSRCEFYNQIPLPVPALPVGRRKE